jgi:hypothetical protein
MADLEHQNNKKNGTVFASDKHTSQGSLNEGRSISTINLLVFTSSEQIFLILNYIFFYKTTYLKEEVNRTEPSPFDRVPCTSLLKTEHAPMIIYHFNF